VQGTCTVCKLTEHAVQRPEVLQPGSWTVLAGESKRGVAGKANPRKEPRRRLQLRHQTPSSAFRQCFTMVSMAHCGVQSAVSCQLVGIHNVSGRSIVR